MAWLEAFAQWLIDVLLYIPRWIWSYIVDLVLDLWFWAMGLVNMGVTKWHQYVGPYFAGPAGYWADVAMLDVGIGMILSAYLMRFFIRRIPIIG